MAMEIRNNRDSVGPTTTIVIPEHLLDRKDRESQSPDSKSVVRAFQSLIQPSQRAQFSSSVAKILAGKPQSSS
jgi:hypothetical protein